MQSKRLVIVSFFTTLTLSAVCQGIFGIITKSLDEGWIYSRIINAIYAVAYSCFLIKYYIDDIIDDNTGAKEEVSRFSSARLIIGWMFLLTSALFVCDVKISSAVWLLGIVVLTWFLWSNRKQLGISEFRRYLWENIVLVFALSFVFGAFTAGHRMCEWISICCTFVFMAITFVVMLLDRTPQSGQSGRDL